MAEEGATRAALFAVLAGARAGKVGADKKAKKAAGKKAAALAGKKAAAPAGGAAAGKKGKGNAKEKKDTSARLDRAEVEPLCGVAAPEEVRAQQFYLTTAINYTNGAPHMGHAYEGVLSDVISRYHRVFGRDVFFLTGSDEHGQKVEQSAEKAGVTPQDIADKYSQGFRDLNVKLDVEQDEYIRTTMAHHRELAQKMWLRVRERGDIYLKDYVGWYNVHEEQYVTDKEAEEKNYQDEHGRPFEKKSEESYFFRMSKYQEALVKHIEENPSFIQPESRRREMLSFLSEPLQDLCVSRTVCQWGIKCPEDPDYKGDKNHVMYVWFDALTNYLSGIRYLSEEDPRDTARFWPASVHIIGKDIVRFHTVIWPTMLMSAGVPLPATVFGHGFVVAADGVKMSKSVGNVLDPLAMLSLYGPDTLRFYLARTATFGADLPFSEEALCSLHNAVLKDGLGNLLHRVTSLCASYSGGKIPSEPAFFLDGKPPFDLGNLRTIFEVCFSTQPGKVAVPADFSGAEFPGFSLDALRRGDGLQVQAAADAVSAAIGALNTYLQTTEPWKIKGTDDATKAKKNGVVRAVLEGVYALAHFLSPFTPRAMDEIFHKLGVKRTFLPLLSLGFDNLPPGTQTYVGPVLFHELAPGKGVVQRGADGAGAQTKEEKAKALAAAKAKKEAARQKVKAAAAKKKDAGPEGPEFTKILFRVGKIVEVWEHPEAERLFCEKIDVGEGEPREIASGLREHYKLEDMKDRLVVVCCNLKPRKLAGFNSQGMVICGSKDGKVELLDPPAGSVVGERLGLEGQNADDFAPEEPSRVGKKKIFEAVAAKLATNDARVGCWDGKPICSAAGPCTVASLTGAKLS